MFRIFFSPGELLSLLKKCQVFQVGNSVNIAGAFLEQKVINSEFNLLIIVLDMFPPPLYIYSWQTVFGVNRLHSGLYDVVLSFVIFWNDTVSRIDLHVIIFICKFCPWCCYEMITLACLAASTAQEAGFYHIDWRGAPHSCRLAFFWRLRCHHFLRLQFCGATPTAHACQWCLLLEQSPF